MKDVRITRSEHRNQISGVFQVKGHWYLADLIELQFGRYLYETPYEFMFLRLMHRERSLTGQVNLYSDLMQFPRKSFCSVLKTFVPLMRTCDCTGD